MDVNEALKAYGLSEKEAAMYLAALSLGGASASDLALKSDLPRTLAYDLLERLIDKGLVTYTVKGSKKWFVAADPEELLRLLEEKKRLVAEVVPALLELQRTPGTSRPTVKIYEGIAGMKTMMNDLLRSGVKEMYAYGSSSISIRVVPAFIKDWHRRRQRLGVIEHIIYNDTPESRRLMNEKEHTMIEYKFMPVNVESPTATIIYGDVVVLQSWVGDAFAVAIKSELMANNQVRYFKELWKIAKE